MVFIFFDDDFSDGWQDDAIKLRFPSLDTAKHVYASLGKDECIHPDIIVASDNKKSPVGIWMMDCGRCKGVCGTVSFSVDFKLSRWLFCINVIEAGDKSHTTTYDLDNELLFVGCTVQNKSWRMESNFTLSQLCCTNVDVDTDDDPMIDVFNAVDDDEGDDNDDEMTLDK